LYFDHPSAAFDDHMHSPVSVAGLLPAIYHAQLRKQGFQILQQPVLLEDAVYDHSASRCVLELTQPDALTLKLVDDGERCLDPPARLQMQVPQALKDRLIRARKRFPIDVQGLEVAIHRLVLSQAITQAIQLADSQSGCSRVEF
jgi:hypothetical protein